MRRARERSSAVVVIVGLVAVCALLWLLRTEVDPGPPAEPARAAAPDSGGAAPAGAASTPTPPPAMPELPVPPEVPELLGRDTVDPCTAVVDAVIPPGFETVIVDGVTVAWRPGALAPQGPYDVAAAPTAIAYLVHGLLVEAAALSGTPRRERVTVVIYPPDTFHLETRAPSWASAIYDGRAVRLATRPSTELGVQISSLRHELMHAQLHPVGCMPAWLNEGAAMYFAGPPPVRAWIRMLRNPDSFDLAQLAVPSFAQLPQDAADRAYAESLAMVLYLVDHGGEPTLRGAVQALRAAGNGTPRAGQELWDRLYPGIGHREVADSLARRVFGAAPGGELDAVLHGAMCCHGLRSPGALRCRGVAPNPEHRRWLDPSVTPAAVCDTAW